MRYGYNRIPGIFNELDYTIPLAGVVTICPDKFFHGKMLVRAVPIHIGSITKVLSYSIPVLCQNIFPKLFYIHSHISAVTLTLSDCLLPQI